MHLFWLKNQLVIAIGRLFWYKTRLLSAGLLGALKKMSSYIGYPAQISL